MKIITQIWILTFFMITLGYTGRGNAETLLNTDLPVPLILSCERQDDNKCVTKKFEQALLESSSLSTKEKLIIKYELAARYEYYEADLNKARNMYMEIAKTNPNYGITQLCIKRLNRQLSGLANR
jgi:hypothetical protein